MDSTDVVAVAKACDYGLPSSWALAGKAQDPSWMSLPRRADEQIWLAWPEEEKGNNIAYFGAAPSSSTSMVPPDLRKAEEEKGNNIAYFVAPPSSSTSMVTPDLRKAEDEIEKDMATLSMLSLPPDQRQAMEALISYRSLSSLPPDQHKAGRESAINAMDRYYYTSEVPLPLLYQQPNTEEEQNMNNLIYFYNKFYKPPSLYQNPLIHKWYDDYVSGAREAATIDRYPEDWEKYQEQIRISEGFDVDHFHWMGPRHIKPLNLDDDYDDCLQDVQSALDRYNHHHNKGGKLEHVKILKFNEQFLGDYIMFMTFIAKDTSTLMEKTYQAKYLLGQSTLLIFKEKDGESLLREE